MVNTSRRREGGWSYLEIVVSFTVLTVILGSLFVAQAREFRYLADAFDETTAERAAAARIETLLAGKAAPEAGTRALGPDPVLAEALPGVRLEEFVREVEPGLFSVEVRVRWGGAGREEHRVTLVSLVATGRRP